LYFVTTKSGIFQKLLLICDYFTLNELFFLLPLLRGRDEPDDVLEGEPANEDGLADCEDEMLLVLALFALKNKKCYLLSCFK
jgi:hypothetical protein